LRTKLSKLLPDVLAEPARFYFWRFLRRLALPRCACWNLRCPRSVGLCRRQLYLKRFSKPCGCIWVLLICVRLAEELPASRLHLLNNICLVTAGLLRLHRSFVQ